MPIREFLRRLQYLINRRRHDDALRQEMEAHRERMAMPRQFGNLRRLREESHDVWGWAWLDDVVRDVRLAVRLLARGPGFTVVALSSLALAFVLVAAALATVNAYLLRPLPYAAADRLYNVMYAPPGPWEPRGVSSLNWKALEDVVEFPITAQSDTFYLGDGAYAEARRALRVAPGFVKGLGVVPSVGRTLEEPDWQAESDAVAMIGHALWRDRYGSDPAILGRVIRVSVESKRGAPEAFRVVGVLPPGFYFGRDSRAIVDVLRPLPAPVQTYVVRLRPGVSAAAAERRLTEAVRAISGSLPSDWTGVHLDSSHDRYVRDLRPVLRGASVAVAAVIGLVCTNLAVLTLLRSMRRQKEWAVRQALGSGHWRLVRMLVVEATVLVGIALTVGLLLTHVGLGLLTPMVEERLGRPAPGGASSLSVDGTVVLLAGVVGVVVALSLALLPILAPRWGRVGDVLQRGRTSTTDGRLMRRLRSGLLACEIAGTLVILIGSGLFVRSTVNMLRADLGFEPDRFVRSRIVLKSADYADGPAYFRFYERFAEAASARTNAPVVFSSWPPFAQFPTLSIETPATMGTGTTAGVVRVGGGYFAASGIGLREGREITGADERTDAAVAVVSASLARRLSPDGSLIGRQIRSLDLTPGSSPGVWRTVVGVARDVRQGYFDSETSDVYFPFPPDARGRYGSFQVRTDMAVATLWPILRAVAGEIDPNAVVDEPQVAATDNEDLAGARFLARAFGVIGSGALLLATLGIYGVTSYSVRQRAREIAVRIALGATRGAIRRMFWRELGWVLAIGVVFGLVLAAAISRVIESHLYVVPADDGATMLAACVLLGSIGMLAAWWPVRQASRQNPMAVLKEG
jgi:putative ABC transport system permease protein